MAIRKDLTGQRFGRWIALNFVGKNKIRTLQYQLPSCLDTKVSQEGISWYNQDGS